MGMDLKVFAEDGWIRAVATGEFSLQEAERTFIELMERVVRHKVEKVLVDGRGLKGDPSVIERFFYGGFTADTVEAHVLDHKIRDAKFAYILLEPVLDPYRLGESVAINRGMQVKAFDDAGQAVQWLGLKPPEQGTAGDA